MMPDVLPEARGELRASALYFDSLQPSKFDDFMDEWNRGVAAIRSNPRLYSPDEDAPEGYEIRTYLFPRFQRRIIYQLIGSRIAVLALAHTQNQPGYWLDRIEGR